MFHKKSCMEDPRAAAVWAEAARPRERWRKRICGWGMIGFLILWKSTEGHRKTNTSYKKVHGRAEDLFP